MTEERSIDTARTGQDEEAARIAEILVATFDADNHDTLDADITRLMLDLSTEMDLEGFALRAKGDERLRTVVKAVLMALRGHRPVSG